MRKYVPKDDVQKKPYYTDRYWVAPQVAKFDVESDEVFAADLATIKEKCEVIEAYIQVDQMVVIIKPTDNFTVLKFLKTSVLITNFQKLGLWIGLQNRTNTKYFISSFL